MWGRDKYSILMQPSLFIIVLFYFTHLSYPSHLPLSLYKRSCILHTKITKEKKRKKESYSYSLIVQSKPQIGSFFLHFSAFSPGFSSPAVPAIVQHHFHSYSQCFTQGFIQFQPFPIQIHPPHHFSALCPYLVIFLPASHCLLTLSFPDTIPRFHQLSQ